MSLVSEPLHPRTCRVPLPQEGWLGPSLCHAAWSIPFRHNGSSMRINLISFIVMHGDTVVAIKIP